MTKTALITGATSGIGAEFAKQLVRDGYNLIITGRRAEKINSFATDLRAKYGVKIDVVIAELSDDEEVNKLVDLIRKLPSLDLLVNNAGFGIDKTFLEEDPQVYIKMVKLHVLTTLKLTRAALEKMTIKNSGAIINVGSLSWFFSRPKNSVYGATKAFIGVLTETIAKELKGTNIKIQVFCPGSTQTDIFKRSGVDVGKHMKKGWLHKKALPEVVVQKSLKCLNKNRVVFIPGCKNKLIAAFGVLRRLIKLL